MYNRYIPQPDGTYRRNRMQDPGKPSQPTPEPRREVPTPPPALEPEVHPCSGCIHRTNIKKPPQSCLPKAATSVSDFLKQLLPKNFDIEDLLVVLLLLLISADCQEDQNTALLTLVLYLFL